MAVVHCRNSNGLILRLYETVDGLLGIKEQRPKGEPVELRPGRNENVDDVFIAAWLEKNKHDELLKRGIIHVEEKAPAAAEPAAQEG